MPGDLRVVDDDEAQYRRLINAATVGHFEGEGWRFRKDGSRFWASVVVDRILDDDGKLIGFAKIRRESGMHVMSKPFALDDFGDRCGRSSRAEPGQLLALSRPRRHNPPP